MLASSTFSLALHVEIMSVGWTKTARAFFVPRYPTDPTGSWWQSFGSADANLTSGEPDNCFHRIYHTSYGRISFREDVALLKMLECTNPHKLIDLLLAE